MQLTILTKLTSRQHSDICKIFYIACTQNIEDAISFADTNDYDIQMDDENIYFIYDKNHLTLAYFTNNL
jgi:hypothetical protein